MPCDIVRYIQFTLHNKHMTRSRTNLGIRNTTIAAILRQPRRLRSWKIPWWWLCAGTFCVWPRHAQRSEYRSRYSDSPRDGRSGHRIPEVGGGGELFCARPDQPWASSRLLYNGYRVCFSEGKAAGALTTHTHLLPRLKTQYNYTSTPCLCLHGTSQGELHLYFIPPTAMTI